MKFLEQNYVKYGLLMSGFTALFILFMHITGGYSNLDRAGQSPIEIFFIIIAPAIVWFLGLKAKRKQLKGKMTFKQGFIEGFKISLIYALTSPFVFLAYYTLLNPSIIEFMKREYRMPDASFQEVVTFDMIVQFVAALVFGTLYGAVLTLFLKTKSQK